MYNQYTPFSFKCNFETYDSPTEYFKNWFYHVGKNSDTFELYLYHCSRSAIVVAGDGKGALKFFFPAFVFLLPFSCFIFDTLYSSLSRC